MSTLIRQTLARASQLETLSQFSFELPPETQALFKQATQIRELLKQPSGAFISKEVQTVLLALPFTHYLTEKDLDYVEKNKTEIMDKFAKHPITKEVFSFNDEQELIKKLDETYGHDQAN